jgi:hypothetical protein
MVSFIGVERVPGLVVDVSKCCGRDCEYAKPGENRVAQRPDGRFPHG